MSSELPYEYRQVFAELKRQTQSVHPKGLSGRPIGFITQFGQLYLKASALFAWAKGQSQWRHYVQPMQRVLVDANLVLYPESKTTWLGLWKALVLHVPAQLWRDRYFHLLATLIFSVSALIAFVLVRQNFELAPVFMPAGIRSMTDLDAYFFSPQARHEMLTYGRDQGAQAKAYFAFFLMQNNIKVAISCFVSGFVFGVPTLWTLIQTGLMMGALPALFYPDDIIPLGAWILPHSVPEVGAILLAGGGGLRIGYSMLNPRSVSPSISTIGRSLQQLMRQLAGTVVVVVVLLIWAAIVESFVRQSTLSDATRYAIAWLSLVPLMGLFLWGFWADRVLETMHRGAQDASGLDA